ncbi:MAG: chorismate synthase [Tepidanaerobacteraceae bacterium]|nr:chorismate synthase [Tepidanaerobacteraceae bacterium]
MLRFLTAGESHGKALIAVIEGLPANLSISEDVINQELQRRRQGYGRGGRMKIEKDEVQIISGIIKGRTIGSPLALMIKNLDYDNWKGRTLQPVTKPRPGHGDLAGILKYNQDDIRNVLERASARETAARVAVGAVAKQLLMAFGVRIMSHVVSIGSVSLTSRSYSIEELAGADKSPVRCIDESVSEQMMKAIDEARNIGDSLGGVFEVVAENVPVGLGSHAHWDRKLDGLIAASFMSIQAVKGVEIGMGFEAARKKGSEVHDEIFYDENRGYFRKTNNAGGLEAGITNGCPVVVRAAMKPIPTLYKPLRSVDIKTKEPFFASIERSDICAVPAASIVGEAALAWVLAEAVVEKFGGDSVEEMRNNFKNYEHQLLDAGYRINH